MARLPRLELAGVPLHVIQRGNNRASCFVSDGDRHLYLTYLADASVRHECTIHAYVLMPNHVHLLVTPMAPGCVAAMMQDVGRRYVRVFNDSHARTGTLWEGRYKAAMIDSERYFVACQRYVELNPVRAGLITDPAQYRWSSYRHYALGAANPLVTAHELIVRLAIDDTMRREAYCALFAQPLDAGLIDEIRVATNKGRVLGSEAFIAQVEAALGRCAKVRKPGRPCRALPATLDQSGGITDSSGNLI
jgi:putative transposase